MGLNPAVELIMSRYGGADERIAIMENVLKAGLQLDPEFEGIPLPLLLYDVIEREYEILEMTRLMLKHGKVARKVLIAGGAR